MLERFREYSKMSLSNFLMKENVYCSIQDAIFLDRIWDNACRRVDVAELVYLVTPSSRSYSHETRENR